MADIIVEDPYYEDSVSEDVTAAALESMHLAVKKENNPQRPVIVPSDASVPTGTNNFNMVCRDFMYQRCKNTQCPRVHDKLLCFHFWKHGACKNNTNCSKRHSLSEPVPPSSNSQTRSEKENIPVRSAEARSVHQKRIKNTECFEPMTRPPDMRLVYDLGRPTDKFSMKLTTRDVLLVPNAFSDFRPGELYARLEAEIKACGIPAERLLKLWHGNDKIEGTHLIADDKTRWKDNCPTFSLIIHRLRAFFAMDIKATRFNWYTDTAQWKPFHHDAAAVKTEMARTQNFTVAVSFGATREAAFEHAGTKTVVSMPMPDGCIYAFTNETNIIWRHGILQDTPVREEGRISVIAWGWIEGLDV